MRRYASMALAGLLLVGCDEPQAAKPDTEPARQSPAAKATAADRHAALVNLSAHRVDELLATKQCVAVDANNADTRDKYGVLPGAVLLSSSQGYDMSELPADKSTKLVFYCGSKRCIAAPRAAERAVAAGYRDVGVMRVGIRGWVAEGKHTARPKS